MTTSLEDLRRGIDALDDRILELLEERAATVAQAVDLKRATGLKLHDPEREQRVLARLEAVAEARSHALFPRSAVRPVFREILSACLSAHRPLTVAYLGPPATFSHMAAQATFGLGAQYVHSSTVPGIFDAVARGSATYGVAPVENSTEGSVPATLDSLLATDLMIRGEIVFDVTQCLIGQTEDLGSIERVYSHPQPLGQCREWLLRNLPHVEQVISLSTTAAAREAVADPRAAAVASKLAADLEGLKVIREGIQDRLDNTTRFAILAEADAPPTGRDKTSLVFSTPDERGALKHVLEILYEESLNLTRIESRPRRGAKLWEYVFFTDLEGHRLDPQVAKALERIGQHCAFVKVLGSYPRAG